MLCSKLRPALTFIFWLLSSISQAQSKIQGTILSNSGLPLVNANVLLLNPKDSSLVKGLLTAEGGKYAFEKLAPGNYLISATHTGFKQGYSSSITLGINESNTTGITLNEINTSLEAVTVVARKPLFEQKVDRMVINVASNITSAGSTVLDVLERSPGVVVDRQNNSLAINGKNGIVVMINGKISRMPVSALVQMLGAMPSDNVEKVELITTPPANFDAEGNAGYINIMLKRNMQYGTNGSYTATVGYRNGPIGDASANINYRSKRWSIYSNYTFTRNHTKQSATFQHAVNSSGKYLENYEVSERDPVETVSDLKLGVDYEIKKDLVIGGLLSFYNRRWDMTANNTSQIYVNGVLDTVVTVLNKENHPMNSYDLNLNLQKNYKGGQVSFNVDYLDYREKNPVTYTNNYYDGNNNWLYEEQMRSNKNTPVKVWVGAIDLEKKLGPRFSMYAGLKGTFSKFTNSVMIEKKGSSGWSTDPDLTATSFLNENISAAYYTVDWAVTEKTQMKGGLRFEYTNSNLETVTQKNIVDRHYGKLFPSYFISHTFNENNSANFAYSRRISRPTFWDMAPFVIFMGPNTLFSGNPALQPSITDNMNLAYTYKRKIVSFAYSYQASPITNFSPHLDPATNKQTLSAENQDHQISWNLSFSLPFTLTKWWDIHININAAYQKMFGFYDGAPILAEEGSLFGNAIQNFKLPKDYTLSLSGFYSTGGQFGLYKAEPLGSLDFGAQKKLKNKKSTFRINYGNILNSLQPTFSVNAPEHNLVTKGQIRFSYPSFRLTFTHNFGSDKVKTQRDRSTGAEEEKDRLKVN